ncbi:DUF4372 domain-containing protein [Candidatus Peregrinibacteria bacterium]|nr:DUF4372 domain-containing protein [Candidatus Peregrinibacteria bacterium]
MFEGRYIFSQIVDFVPRREFDACIEKFNGNSRIRKINCRDQFLALMFGQLTGLSSATPAPNMGGATARSEAV